MNNLPELAYQPLAAGFVLALLTLFFGAVLLGFVGWMKDFLG
jgi:hypothetical protein